MIQQAIQFPALITHLKGFSNYTWLHYCDGRKLLVAKSLVYFEGRLPGFFRIHKTALVNPHYITDLQAPPGHKMAGSVTVQGETILPVSRRRWQEIINPLTVAMLKSSALYATSEVVQAPVSQSIASFVEPISRAIKQPFRHLWIVMADEMKAGLVRQLVHDKWPQWWIELFETGTRLRNALPEVIGDYLPAMIILDGSESRSMPTLKSIKKSPSFRFIPTLLLSSAEDQDQAQEGYASGANSVIVHPSDLTRFIQVLERTLRYWLTMVAVPQVVAAPRPLPA
ncbi:response regulator transcription factor [Larkinella rosea]|uniref:Response regulatory domain-containing protein n=1 Tax=Larkinella rosea TaxID=2025312 RepID=A0A3P1BJ12_9BACT|nr:LytTR family transcriptional regulator DNA-binding domain-containing protein [Larkinella rosea]RRB00823.1 hypothetical protein EHT25_21760 [Larkinella rosea]